MQKKIEVYIIDKNIKKIRGSWIKIEKFNTIISLEIHTPSSTPQQDVKEAEYLVKKKIYR